MPIVQNELAHVTETKENKQEERVDKRKQKQRCYREYRLGLAHEAGSTTLPYAATLGHVDPAGEARRRCLEQLGINIDSKATVFKVKHF